MIKFSDITNNGHGAIGSGAGMSSFTTSISPTDAYRSIPKFLIFCLIHICLHQCSWCFLLHLGYNVHSILLLCRNSSSHRNNRTFGLMLV